MAGKYSRFVEEGIKFPKYLLPWGEKNILTEILKQMQNEAVDKIFLVANKADKLYMPHVRRILKSFDIDPGNLVLIDDTGSQAETAWLGIQEILKFDSLVGPFAIHNIDTILYQRSWWWIDHDLKGADGYIDIFKSNNRAYSYVLVKNEEVKEIREKMLISDTATSGFYGFSSPEMFMKYYEEGYISNVYRKMIADGKRVVVGKEFDEHNTLVLGTPAEYLQLSNFIE